MSGVNEKPDNNLSNSIKIRLNLDESDIASRYTYKKSNLMFTLSSHKDQRKIAFANCKLTFTLLYNCKRTFTLQYTASAMEGYFCPKMSGRKGLKLQSAMVAGFTVL